MDVGANRDDWGMCDSQDCSISNDGPSQPTMYSCRRFSCQTLRMIAACYKNSATQLDSMDFKVYGRSEAPTDQDIHPRSHLLDLSKGKGSSVFVGGASK